MRSLLIRTLSVCLGISYLCLAAPQDYPLDRTRSANTNKDAAVYCESSIEDVVAEVGEYPKPQDSTFISVTSPSPSKLPELTAASIPQTLSSGMMDLTASPRPNMPHVSTDFILVHQRISERRRRRSIEQYNPISLAFSILGASIGVVILILCGRSICHYYRTPRRDMVQDHIDRYNLEKELAEIERPRVRGIIAAEELIASPPPPYFEEVLKCEVSTKQAPIAAGCPR